MAIQFFVQSSGTFYNNIVFQFIENHCYREIIIKNISVTLLLIMSIAFSTTVLAFGFTNSSNTNILQQIKTNAKPVVTPTDPKDRPGYKEMLAIKKAYPSVVKKIQYRRGDWALLVKDTWFYWAGGRLLQKKHLEEIQKYDPQQFYSYYAGPVQPRNVTPEQVSQILEYQSKETNHPDTRLPNFYNTLWGSWDSKSSYKMTARMKLWGKKVTVHKALVPTLNRIEKEINIKAKKDKILAAFLKEIRVVGGWHYRVILGTQSRSLHSYGVAIDFEPLRLESYNTYWRWTRKKMDDWYRLTYADLWIPPDSFIQVFEKYGFVWGGKWLYFDTIHFEYRPEILFLNGITPLPMVKKKK